MPPLQVAGAGVQAPACPTGALLSRRLCALNLLVYAPLSRSRPALQEPYSPVVQHTNFTCFTSTKVQIVTGEEAEAFSAACLS
jgi:hypothetical protein